MSDWGGTHDRIAGIRAGEDLEMPGDTAVSLKKVYDALRDGSLSDDEANACVTRILAATERFATASKTEAFDRDGHAELAACVAADSAVLMKNDGTLPLDSTKPLCVIGELFEKMLRSAALDAGVELRQIEVRTQASDHPILWNVPETDYLKFYLFQVV